jgi:peptidoglycan/LPS O-acetylase OafA/YrhL
LKYRPEIDGMRALAVIPVIFFHAGFEAFSGGFIGVDIFFVISGYLITTIVLNEIEGSSFSLLSFYERRAKRILPALFFVMFVCLPFSWFWMGPDQLQEFAGSLVAVSFFSSNVLFWRESSYFSLSADEKPLLHTWSLGVEEQYYLIFPIFLLFTLRFGKNRTFWIIGIISGISLLLSEWGWRNASTANFYLAPTRAWELLAGSMAAFLVQKNGVQNSNILSIIGLSAIVVSIFQFTENTPMPSVYTLIPVVGAVLIILYGGFKTITAKVLSVKLFLGIGLISYSAYLWHQPLFAFARIQSSSELSFILSGFLILGTFILAFLSWRFIEGPCRRLRTSRKTVFICSLVGIIIFALIGLFGHVTKGVLSRFPDEQIQFLEYFSNDAPDWAYFKKNNIQSLFRNECNFFDLEAARLGNATNRPRDEIDHSCTEVKSNISNILFIWGDSHGEQLNSGFTSSLDDNWEVLQVASSGCEPSVKMNADNAIYCNKSNSYAKSAIERLKPNIVLLAQNTNHKTVELNSIATEILSYGVGHVLIVGPTPHWHPHLPSLLFKRWPNFPERLSVGLVQDSIVTDKILKQYFSNKADISYVSLIELLCNRNGCLTSVNGNYQSGITSWDDGHITPITSRFIVNQLVGGKLNSLFYNSEKN